MSEDLLYLIALTKVSNVGPILAKTLISYCGGIQQVFQTPASKLYRIPNIGKTIAQAIKKADYIKEAENEIKFLKNNNVYPISYLDPAYPKRLLNYEDSPLLLYYKGNADLNTSRTVAIVGTRTPSEYGKLQCETIVNGLVPYEVVIISGLAYGIDTVAHRCALKNNLPTIGILGHGLDRIYPRENRNIAIEMTNKGGLLTEFSSKTKPDRENFPMRNRIIAAISDVVVVVESAKSGGSIITAEYANNYEKDVFAVPGRVNDEKSIGTNNLIKKHKAYLIETADDIIYNLRWELAKEKNGIQTQLFYELDDNEKQIYNYLKSKGISALDQIHLHLNIPLSKLANTLLQMEFKGLVKTLPGKRFTLY